MAVSQRSLERARRSMNAENERLKRGARDVMRRSPTMKAASKKVAAKGKAGGGKSG